MFNKKVFISTLSVILLLVLSVGAFAATRTGTWVDEVIILEEPSSATAIKRLQAKDIDIYVEPISETAAFDAVKQDPNLDYYQTFGSYSEITFNTVGPEFNDGRLNPFSNRKIREAMNYLLDRDYIAQEVYGGLAVPKYTIMNSRFADYARVVETARALEIKYGHDKEKAINIIAEEMVAMGAEKVNGKWHYNGSPVVLKILIRNEDERMALGDYLASLLEDAGFTAERNYRTGSEASPVWLSGDPWKGEWHAYTGGWLAPVVYRNQEHIFNQMYHPSGMSAPPWAEMKPIPELIELSDILYNKQYKSIEERNAVYSRALELAYQDSPRIFAAEVVSFIARRSEISVASDLAGGVSGTSLWPSTIRRNDEVGGQIRMATGQLLIDPWNPVAGSNWSNDKLAITATMDRGIIVDPFTGLHWPHRLERAEVYIREGLPVTKTLDWVDLEFVDKIDVPADAWADWDPVAQEFITAGEKWPEGITAERMVRVYFRDDFYKTSKWHDGSPVSLADIVYYFILSWDRGMEESAIFDQSAVADLVRTRQSFRGLRIVSEDPLVFEYYSDSYALDAEHNVVDLFPVEFNYGKAPWHTLAVGALAEANGELAFTADKANRLEVEWLGYHTGPSLPILYKYLQQAKAEAYIPYAPTLSKYITPEEAVQRYSNAEAWYKEKGHLWIGDGPMYLERAYPTERMIHLKRFEDYSEPADKWSMFDEPRIAEVDVVGPPRITIGHNAIFDVEISFEGEPYPLEHIQEVKYILIDANNEVSYSGYAKPVVDGLFEIEFSAEETNALVVGSNTIEVIVLPTVVGGASLGKHTFITLPRL